MRVGAPRGTLRKGCQPYGVQQSRNLRNARKRDEGIPRAIALRNSFFRVLKARRISEWARPVPAAAVIPAPQVALAFIGSKASVAGSLSFL